MAILSKLTNVNAQPNARTSVSGDYCFNRNYFQIRTYKAGDASRSESSKQNIQLDQAMAENLVRFLNQFIDQN